LTNRLLGTLKQKIKNLTLIPSGGGCFELTVDGELVYSKLQTGKFPDEKWAVDAVQSRLMAKA
jgi:selenoprotein W-related protein